MSRRSSALAAALLLTPAFAATLAFASPAHADSGDRWAQGRVVNTASQPLADMIALFGWCETKTHHAGCTLIKYQHRSGNDDYSTGPDGSFRLGWPTWKHPAVPGHWVVTINRDPATKVKVSKPRAGHGVKLGTFVQQFQTQPPTTAWTGPTLSGVITGANGAPIPSAMVDAGPYSAWTDGNGHYELDIPAGTTGMTMSVQAYGYVWYHDVPITGTFTGSSAVHQDVVLSPDARIKARLDIPRSWRSWRTRVNVKNASYPASDGTTYGAYGPGKVDVGVEPGTYILTMTARPGAHGRTVRTATRTVTVTSGETLKLGLVHLHKS